MTEPDDHRDECGNCGATTTDMLCRRCIAKAEKWAAEMPALVTELETTIGRRSRNAGAGAAPLGSNDPNAPLPIDLNAVEKRDHVDAFLAWAQHITAEAATAQPARSLAVADPRRLVTGAAVGIVANVAWFRTAPDALDALQALWTIRTTLSRAIDRPADRRWYAGPCGHVKSWATLEQCELPLYARPGQDKDGNPHPIVCDGWLPPFLRDDTEPTPPCETSHSYGERRAFLLASLADEILPLDLILPALPGLIDRNPDRATVRQWRARKQLRPHGVNLAGVPLYRGADVLRLAMDKGTRPGPKRRDTLEAAQ